MDARMLQNTLYSAHECSALSLLEGINVGSTTLRLYTGIFSGELSTCGTGANTVVEFYIANADSVMEAQVNNTAKSFIAMRAAQRPPSEAALDVLDPMCV